MTPEALQAMLSVNLIGVSNAWQAALPDMKVAGWGRMIAIASTAGLKGYPYVAAYCAAKHGVVGLTRALSLELAGTGITVNAICPGFIETPMLERSVANIVEKTGMTEDAAREALYAGNPQKRFIQTDEVAGTALWLCSDAARSVNGHALSLSGGEDMTADPAPAPEPLSKERLRLWLKLLKASRSIEDEVRRRLRREHDWTLPRFDVMSALARAPDGLKMSEISRMLKVSNGNITGIVDKLAQEGPGAARGHPRRPARHLVRLTPKGQSTLFARHCCHRMMRPGLTTFWAGSMPMMSAA